ncbi:hypothetical protein HDV00_001187 [Rhizophlyctis rosea]|nr:hypothetical protein HDV00_001187 [Rhizophlyctis rosea]
MTQAQLNAIQSETELCTVPGLPQCLDRCADPSVAAIIQSGFGTSSWVTLCSSQQPGAGTPATGPGTPTTTTAGSLPGATTRPATGVTTTGAAPLPTSTNSASMNACATKCVVDSGLPQSVFTSITSDRDLCKYNSLVNCWDGCNDPFIQSNLKQEFGVDKFSLVCPSGGSGGSSTNAPNSPSTTNTPNNSNQVKQNSPADRATVSLAAVAAGLVGSVFMLML